MFNEEDKMPRSEMLKQFLERKGVKPLLTKRQKKATELKEYTEKIGNGFINESKLDMDVNQFFKNMDLKLKAATGKIDLEAMNSVTSSPESKMT